MPGSSAVFGPSLQIGRARTAALEISVTSRRFTAYFVALLLFARWLARWLRREASAWARKICLASRLSKSTGSVDASGLIVDKPKRR
jgi:hypothetical protein